MNVISGCNAGAVEIGTGGGEGSGVGRDAFGSTVAMDQEAL